MRREAAADDPQIQRRFCACSRDTRQEEEGKLNAMVQLFQFTWAQMRYRVDLWMGALQSNLLSS